MGRTEPDYGQTPGDSSASEWDRLETLRGRQRQRALAIQLADIYFEAARCYARLGLGHIPKATGLLVKAVAEYQAAGLTRRGQIAWRYAQRLHRAAPPYVMPDERPPTPRMLELADAVVRLTERHGRPPSWRELAAALDIGIGTVRDLADRARNRGLVVWEPGEHYTIRAVPRSRWEGSR